MPGIAKHSTPVDTESKWDGGAAEKNLNGSEANNKKMYAWQDAEGDPEAQGSFKFPHHNVNDDGTPGAANAAGASAAIGALNGARGGGPNIPAGDKQAVHDHLSKHLKDADMEPPDLVAASPAVVQPGEDVEPLQDNSFSMPVMVIEGAWTGDNRKIDPACLTWRDLPLPVMAITKTTMGHDDAELVGKLTSVTREDAGTNGLTDSRTGEPYPDGTTYLSAEGEFDSADLAQEIKRLVADGFLRGVSVDLGDVTSDLVLVGADGEESEVDFLDWLFGDGEEDGELGEKVTKGRVMGVTICPFPAFEGAYIKIPDGAGTLVSAVVSSGEFGPSIFNHDKPFMREGPVTAGAGPIRPPHEWFDNPQFDGPAPMTVEADGRVYGHLATWRECHTGITGQCVRAPHSATDYAYFTTGAVLCDDDELVSTGPITLGTGHAEMWHNATSAKEHYDNTGTAVVDVSMGEDNWGIWFAGALRPNVDATAVRTLRASALSGDWRQVGGRLELVAALAVNVPGFPVVRPAARVASGMPQALVAAGIVTDAVVRKTKPQAEAKSTHSVEMPEKYERMVKETLRTRVHQHDQ